MDKLLKPPEFDSYEIEEPSDEEPSDEERAATRSATSHTISLKTAEV